MFVCLDYIAKQLSGRWITRTGHVWTCSKLTNTQLDCDGNKATINGGELVWENNGLLGIINGFDEIGWENGNFWKKEGIKNSRILNFTTCFKFT